MAEKETTVEGYFIKKLRNEIRNGETSYYQCYRCCIVNGYDSGDIKKMLVLLHKNGISLGAARIHIRLKLIHKLKSQQNGEKEPKRRVGHLRIVT